MNEPTDLTGASLGREAIHQALDILGGYTHNGQRHSARAIKAAMDAAAEVVSYSDLPHDTPDAGAEGAYARVLDRAEAKQLAQRALSVLTPEERDVIEYRFGFRGYPLILDSVGRVLGISPGTVRGRYYRALDKMREELGGHG